MPQAQSKGDFALFYHPRGLRHKTCNAGPLGWQRQLHFKVAPFILFCSYFLQLRVVGRAGVELGEKSVPSLTEGRPPEAEGIRGAAGCGDSLPVTVSASEASPKCQALL